MWDYETCQTNTTLEDGHHNAKLTHQVFSNSTHPMSQSVARAKQQTIIGPASTWPFEFLLRISKS
ncbi:unnamed protein product, partial [Musa hybrid cultivar]